MATARGTKSGSRRSRRSENQDRTNATRPATKLVGHYIASTHWDREWYEPFQYYRARLVDVLDGALELLERDLEYRFYQ
ncbi:MAG: hypothetical protein AB1716_11325, partial [Planctomycetota bacterium]